jgi:hypothetical protein
MDRPKIYLLLEYANQSHSVQLLNIIFECSNDGKKLLVEVARAYNRHLS